MSSSSLNPCGSTRTSADGADVDAVRPADVEDPLVVGMPERDHPRALGGVLRRQEVRATLGEAVEAARDEALDVLEDRADAGVEQELDPRARREHARQVGQAELVAAAVRDDAAACPRTGQSPSGASSPM